MHTAFAECYEWKWCESEGIHKYIPKDCALKLTCGLKRATENFLVHIGTHSANTASKTEVQEALEQMKLLESQQHAKLLESQATEAIDADVEDHAQVPTDVVIQQIRALASRMRVSRKIPAEYTEKIFIVSATKSSKSDLIDIDQAMSNSVNPTLSNHSSLVAARRALLKKMLELQMATLEKIESNDLTHQDLASWDAITVEMKFYPLAFKQCYCHSPICQLLSTEAQRRSFEEKIVIVSIGIGQMLRSVCGVLETLRHLRHIEVPEGATWNNFVRNTPLLLEMQLDPNIIQRFADEQSKACKTAIQSFWSLMSSRSMAMQPQLNHLT